MNIYKLTYKSISDGRRYINPNIYTQTAPTETTFYSAETMKNTHSISTTQPNQPLSRLAGPPGFVRTVQSYPSAEDHQAGPCIPTELTAYFERLQLANGRSDIERNNEQPDLSQPDPAGVFQEATQVLLETAEHVLAERMFMFTKQHEEATQVSLKSAKLLKHASDSFTKAYERTNLSSNHSRRLSTNSQIAPDGPRLLLQVLVDVVKCFLDGVKLLEPEIDTAAAPLRHFTRDTTTWNRFVVLAAQLIQQAERLALAVPEERDDEALRHSIMLNAFSFSQFIQPEERLVFAMPMNPAATLSQTQSDSRTHRGALSGDSAATATSNNAHSPITEAEGDEVDEIQPQVRPVHQTGRQSKTLNHEPESDDVDEIQPQVQPVHQMGRRSEAFTCESENSPNSSCSSYIDIDRFGRGIPPANAAPATKSPSILHMIRSFLIKCFC